jgi:hypothetical protein
MAAMAVGGSLVCSPDKREIRDFFLLFPFACKPAMMSFVLSLIAIFLPTKNKKKKHKNKMMMMMMKLPVHDSTNKTQQTMFCSTRFVHDLSSGYLHKVAWWIIEYDKGRQDRGLREKQTEERDRGRDRDRFFIFGRKEIMCRGEGERGEDRSCGRKKGGTMFSSLIDSDSRAD